MIRQGKGSVASEILARYRDRNAWTEATADLEFKSGKADFPKSVWESYSAFANSSGGYIVIGVKNDGTIEGVAGKATQYRDYFVNTLSSGNKCDYMEGASGGNIAIVEIEHQEVLVIKVKAADVGQKPVCLEGNLQKTYVRCMEGDRRCTPQELSRMIRDRDVVNTRFTIDDGVIANSGIQDLDADTIRQYREDMGRTLSNHAWLGLDDETLMMKLGAYRTDRKTGQRGLTLAGLLMFGRTETIMELHPGYKVDFYEYDGSELINNEQRWADRITVDGTWEANLYQFYKRVWPRLTADLKRPFRLSVDMKRQDDSTAHEAVREALANALIHTDYIIDGGIQIIKRPNGLTLINAGTLLLSEKDIFAGGNSRCRNRNLQKMFKLAGIVDEAGSGVDKMTRGWFEHFLSMPELLEEKDVARITWTLSYAAMLSRGDMAAQRAYLGIDAYNRLSTLEKIVLLMIPGNAYVSNSDLRKYMPRLHSVDMGRVLSKLRDVGYLDSKGRSNAMKYTLAQPLARAMVANHVGNSSVLNGSIADVNNIEISVSNNDSSILNEGDSSILNRGSSILNSSQVDGMDALEQKLGLSESLCTALIEYRHKNRHTRQETDELVLRLCKGRYLTVSQLCILLDRELVSLRRDCIGPLIRHGKLKHKEEKITHKNQAYTAT